MYKWYFSRPAFYTPKGKIAGLAYIWDVIDKQLLDVGDKYHDLNHRHPLYNVLFSDLAFIRYYLEIGQNWGQVFDNKAQSL